MASDRTVRFALFLGFVALTGGIALVRVRNALPLTPEAIRDVIRSWGSLGPLIFTGAFVLRPFLFFPSTLLFLAGGLAFGVGWGTLYAAVGGTAGAVVGFTIARVLGYDFVRSRFGKHLAAFPDTPWEIGVVALLNLVPVVPMTAINYGAGLSGMGLLPFMAGVVAGLIPRAFAYSLFGHSLLHIRSSQFVLAVALLGMLLVLPISLRHRLSKRRGGDSLPVVGPRI